MPQPDPGSLPHAWPEIPEPTFLITVDIAFEPEGPEPGRPHLVFRVGDREIFRAPSWYENGDHIGEVCRDMRDAYRGRIKDLVLAPGAENAIYLDDFNAGAKLRRAFKPLRKDYLRARAASGASAPVPGED